MPPVQAAADATAQLWLPEVHCLRGHCSPADIWLPQHDLAIQIDGAGHQYVDVHTKTLAQQQETDNWFDNEIVRQGLRAVRIHYRDAERAAELLAAAIQRCEQSPDAFFVMYSSSYKRPIKLTVDADHMEEVGKRLGAATAAAACCAQATGQDAEAGDKIQVSSTCLVLLPDASGAGDPFQVHGAQHLIHACIVVEGHRALQAGVLYDDGPISLVTIHPQARRADVLLLAVQPHGPPGGGRQVRRGRGQ